MLAPSETSARIAKKAENEMKYRWLWRTWLFTLLGSLTGSCSGDEPEPESTGSATCAAVCAEQNDLCGDSTDCSMLCSKLAEMNLTTGCGAEYQEGLECLANAKQCDENETICPGTSYLGCIDAYCAAHPTEPFC